MTQAQCVMAMIFENELDDLGELLRLFFEVTTGELIRIGRLGQTRYLKTNGFTDLWSE